MRLELGELLEKCKKHPFRRIAVAAAGDLAVLQAVAAAYKEEIALPILCGDIEKIDFEARLHNIDISAFEIIEAEGEEQSVSIAVSLVRQGRADMLMKGLVHTADLLRGVLNRHSGLREESVLSHVGLIDCPTLSRTLFFTDAAILPYPTLEDKKKLVENAVDAARALGVERPVVAVLAATELVNPNMQATLDAAALTAMNRRRQIQNCLVEGPLAFDTAISADASLRKKIDAPAAGQADILLFHNIEAANAAVKSLTVIGGCLMGGIVMGASAPIILASRSDSQESKLYSIAAACAISAVKKHKA